MSWQEADELYDYQSDQWHDRAKELASNQLTKYEQDNKDEVRDVLSRAYFIIQRDEALGYDTKGSFRTLDLVSELHPTKNSPEAYLDAVQELCNLAIEGVRANV